MFNLQENAFFTGRKGHGKTTAAKNFLKNFKEKIILDTNSEHLIEDQKTAHKKVVTSIDEFFASCANIKKYNLTNYSLLFQPEKMLNDDEFNYFCDTVCKVKNLRVHIEEIQEYINPKYYPDSFRTMTTRSRHKNLGFSVTTVSPLLTHKLMLNQCDLLFIGNLQGERERDFFHETLSEKTRQEIQYLEKREFFLYNTNTYQTKKINNVFEEIENKFNNVASNIEKENEQ